jgi:uncharacterized membrane protein required for colicin V production
VLAVLGAARSGWRRGVVFFAVDLAGFLGTVLLAVRFRGIPAAFAEFLGFSDNVASVIGGVVIFVPLIIVVALVGARMSHAMYRPGLYTLDKVLGAAVAALLAITIAIVGMLFVRSLDIPFGLGDLIKRSAIAPAVIEAAEPTIAVLDDTLGLDLCDGRLKRIIPEVCEKTKQDD